MVISDSHLFEILRTGIRIRLPPVWEACGRKLLYVV